MPDFTLQDIVVPEIFDPYVAQSALDQSALVQSGIIVLNPAFDQLAGQPASIVNMPFFSDLTGDSEQVVEGENLTDNPMACKKDRAPIIRRGKMWSATDLSAAMNGADPVAAVADMVAAFWSRDMQNELLNMLAGAFLGDGMEDNCYDISEGAGNSALLTPEAFIDATQKLGDASESLCAVMMHSAVKAYLKKQDLIETVRPSAANPFDTYQGVRVIVDDNCPVTGGVYRSYLFGQGAVAFGNGNPLGFVPSELDRDRKKGSGVDYLISRRTFILHPRGIAFTGADMENPEGPSRQELANGQNWQRVYAPKHVRMVAFDYKIG